MELNHTIESFEELGMINPFDRKKSIELADVMLRIYDFYVDVYPDAVMEIILRAVAEKTNVQPPKCIFIPDKSLMRLMIKALVKWHK
jgi:hypothetical protein